MSKTEAKIVDQTLIVSAKDAQSPSLWRGDLTTYKSASFSVSVMKTKASLKVQLEGAKAETIADYKNADAANEALSVVTDALLKPAAVAAKPVTFGSKVLMFLQIVVFSALATYLSLFIIPMKYLGELAPNTSQKPAMTSSVKIDKQTPAPKAPVVKDEGKPVSANDFFAE